MYSSSGTNRKRGVLGGTFPICGRIRSYRICLNELLQLRVLRLGLLQDRDVGVGVLPKREEILIGSDEKPEPISGSEDRGRRGRRDEYTRRWKGRVRNRRRYHSHPIGER